MQTGQSVTNMELFDRIPTLGGIFEAIGDVNTDPIAHKNWDERTHHEHRTLVRKPKSLRDIFSEQLRTSFVKKGTVIYEQGRKGLQMYFILSGKVEFLKWDKEVAGKEPEEVGELSIEVGETAEKILAQAAFLAQGEVEGFSFTGHRRRSVHDMKLDRFQVVASLGEGGHFGELAILKGKAGGIRLTTAVAVEDTQLFSLHVGDLLKMAEVRNFTRSICCGLTNILRSSL
jgi:CRP-like cAMP-binding protein